MPNCTFCQEYLFNEEKYQEHLRKRRLEGGHGLGEREAGWVMSGQIPKLQREAIMPGAKGKAPKLPPVV